MSDLKTILADNEKELRRLTSLIGRLGEKDMKVRLPNAWTVSAALVHLAFWDLRQLTMIKRWQLEGGQPGSLDAVAVNDPLSLLAEFIPRPTVLNLAKSAAEAAAKEVADLTPAQAEELIGLGLERNLHRALHWRGHLDKIEAALGKA